MYSKLEIALIIHHCKNTTDLMAVARAYWYLQLFWRQPHWEDMVNMIKVKEKQFKNRDIK